MSVVVGCARARLLLLRPPANSLLTPLVLPLPQGYEAATALLLERGASLTVADWEGHTACMYPLIRTDQPKQGGRLTAPERAAQEERRLRLLDLLLNAAEQRHPGGASQLANMQSTNGWSTLHLAARNNLLKAAQLLLDHGADARCGAVGAGAARLRLASVGRELPCHPAPHFVALLTCLEAESGQPIGRMLMHAAHPPMLPNRPPVCQAARRGRLHT